MSLGGDGAVPGAGRRLGFAALGVLLGAADTYVVVIALPAIMSSVGIDLTHLGQATPIISGFLLGYIAVLPLLGRLSDLFGRAPVLLGCLLVFALGSLVTASANSLTEVVVGRTLQGAGGGGLVPVTLALVADLWPPRRRGVPLGVVGAVQEFGSVAGPLYGAAVTAAGTWRAIFYINVPLAAVVAAGVRSRRVRSADMRRIDLAGTALALLCAAATGLAIAAPPALADSVAAGTAFVPLVSGLAITSPVAVVAVISAGLLLLRVLHTPASVRPLVDLRVLPAGLRSVDWPGAVLVAAALGVLFVIRELRSDDPLVDLRALANRAATGSLFANLAVGAALMAALVDIPVFARATVDPDSQLDAALVLARLLIAVPVGALLGGVLVGRLGYRAVAGLGMAITALMFVLMAGWSATTLSDPLLTTWLHPSDPVLVACGLGFGLSIVPVTAAMLGAVPARLHGVAASLTVAARMVGMLTGLAVLTAIGLRRFYSVQAVLPNPAALCPRTPLQCPAYNVLETGAVIDELHVIFVGAAMCAVVAAIVAATLLRRHGDEDAAGVLGLGVVA